MLWAPISTQKKQKLWPKGFPGDSDSKKSACHTEDPGSIPGSGRSPGEVNGNPLQYSCLENFMDREAWQATGHGIAELDMTKCLTLSFSSFMTWRNLNQKQGKLRTDLECIVYSQRVIVSLNVYLAELYKVLFSTQPRHLKIWQPVHKLCVCVCTCVFTHKQNALEHWILQNSHLGRFYLWYCHCSTLLKPSASFYKPYKKINSITLYWRSMFDYQL